MTKIADIESPSLEEARAMPPAEALLKFAPLIIAVLKLVKIFTGRRGDEKIDAVIAWLQGLTILGGVLAYEPPAQEEGIV